LIQAAYFGRVSLSEKGFYATPLIHYDRSLGQGNPFYYYAFGAAVSEVSVDTLSGEYQVTRVDILHDVGDSLNPAIDIGQVEGGFIQGMGWLTSEELDWNADGQLMTTGPATYKIPTFGDLPPVFNVALMEGHPNSMASIYRSKAVGEPPFMLAISVWSALRDALASLADYRRSPRLDTPATPERVLLAAEALRREQVSA
jgi:xanthine dehydrogenase large subunit